MFDNCASECEELEEIEQSQIFKNIPFSAVGRDLYGILMTPICDIAQNKTNFCSFCPVLPFDQLFNKLIEDQLNITAEEYLKDFSKTKEKRIKDSLDPIIKGKVYQYHWIGVIPNLSGKWYIDYTLTECLNLSQIESLKQNRVGKLISPYKESVITKYSAYLGRIGLPGGKTEQNAYIDALMEEAKGII